MRHAGESAFSRHLGNLLTNPLVWIELATGFDGGRWVMARDLQVGDSLFLSSGASVAVERVSIELGEDARIRVFNLNVARAHNFAVGPSGVLVHNCEPKLFHNTIGDQPFDFPRLYSAKQVTRSGFHKKGMDVVVKADGSLAIGGKKAGHVNLAPAGESVQFAGEARFVDGQLRSLNTSSGHFQPTGPAARAQVEAAFKKAGIPLHPKYVYNETRWSEEAGSWVAAD